MRQIISENNEQFILPTKLKGKEFVAYATKSDTPEHTYCVLTRLENGKFGFINICYTGTAPSIVGDSFMDCVEKASKKRKVCVFDTYEEMLTAIINKSF